jgi:thiamine transport system substrate-binding protein
MKRIAVVTILLVVMVAGCSTDEAGQVEGPRELVVMTHDSFALSESVLQQFEEANDAKVSLLPAGDAGSALNQAILAKDDPLADVFFGVDNTFLSRALAADIFEPYESPALASVGEAFILDESYRLLPVDYGDVCLNYDRAWFAEAGMAPPAALAELTDPAYRSLLVVQNPGTSSPGLAFMLATIDAFGIDGEYDYLAYWGELRANDVLVTDGWEDAYYGYFSAASDGERPLVVSYASSPPAEVVFAEPPVDEPPTASVTAPGTCFRQVEFIGIMAGTEERALAEAFVDFALGRTFQEDIPLNMFVFPVNEEATLPEVFQQWADEAKAPASVDAQALDENREVWIREWTEVVLR